MRVGAGEGRVGRATAAAVAAAAEAMTAAAAPVIVVAAAVANAWTPVVVGVSDKAFVTKSGSLVIHHYEIDDELHAWRRGPLITQLLQDVRIRNVSINTACIAAVLTTGDVYS